MNYEVLKKRIAKGKQRVITNLVEHLWPHPSAELPVGWRTLNSVVRKLAKRDRAKVARIGLCLLDEYLPTVLPLLDKKLAESLVPLMAALQSCADGTLEPWDAWQVCEDWNEHPGHFEGARTVALRWVGEDLCDAITDVFDAIVPSNPPELYLQGAFSNLMLTVWALEPDDRDDFLGPSETGAYEDINAEFKKMHIAKCIGRIESKFAFSDALTAVLE